MEERHTDENSVMTHEVGESLLDDLLLFLCVFNLLFLEENYSQVLLQCFPSSSPWIVTVLESKVLTTGAKRMPSQTSC